MDESGVLTDDLKRIVEENLTVSEKPMDKSRPFKAMFYTIPTFHNPTGACLADGV